MSSKSLTTRLRKSVHVLIKTSKFGGETNIPLEDPQLDQGFFPELTAEIGHLLWEE